MRLIGSITVVLPAIYLFIGYTNGISVHEDENETPTTQIAVLTTAINPSDKLSNITSRNMHTQNSTSHGHSIIKSSTLMRNSTKIRDVANMRNITAANPWPNISTVNETNNIGIDGQHHLLSNIDSKNWQTPTMKYETSNIFIPSPELIVDTSQSSESTENNHRYVVPFPLYNNKNSNHSKSRSNLPTNVSQDSANNYAKFTIDGVAQNTLSTIPADGGSGSVLNENDKLPWPYENAAREFKWKTIKPTKPVTVLFKRNYVNLNHTDDKNVKVLPRNTVNTETTQSSTSILSTNTYPSLATATLPAYHPYTFENIHTSLPSSEFPTYQPEIHENHDALTQPIEQQNETNKFDENYDAKDNIVPVQRINKEILWHTALKWMATAIPIGLVISALVPNVVVVNTNSTSPYSTTIYPTPYHLKTTPKTTIYSA
ncbi:rhoGEF domain-containing protein gxcI-like [Contarinia nasturtii]|uniref:rhoGEF domain-containing protein gxcI-like n=1 Tax=Contarinia nasturtii TaxID=265458 RepID=UPI0012D39246|nr:rhoGEF domain-containing protein gxcI-like [Contarinia nasturtii]